MLAQKKEKRKDSLSIKLHNLKYKQTVGPSWSCSVQGKYISWGKTVNYDCDSCIKKQAHKDKKPKVDFQRMKTHDHRLFLIMLHSPSFMASRPPTVCCYLQPTSERAHCLTCLHGPSENNSVSWGNYTLSSMVACAVFVLMIISIKQNAAVCYCTIASHVRLNDFCLLLLLRRLLCEFKP